MLTKKNITYLLTVLLSAVLLFAACRYIRPRMTYHYAQADFIAMKAKVVEILDRQETPVDLGSGTTVTDRAVTFRAKLLNEYRKGTEVETVQYLDGYLAGNAKEVEPGDRVLLYETHDEQGYSYAFTDFWRSDVLLWLLGIFVAAVLFFGRFKGLNTLFGLGFTCLFVFMVFIPAILAGQNIYLWSILTCLYSIVTTLLIVDGISRKTFIAAAGCFGGVLVAGCLTAVLNCIMHITGLVDEQSMYLNDLSSDLSIDLRAVVFAAIIIGATGAVMDVAISIASALGELNEQMEHPTFGALLRSGFSIGRDMMGTMANTLVLAYIGSSLATVVLIVAYNSSLANIFNREMIVVEVEQALVGSLGILSAIPLTSLLGAAFYPLHRKKSAA